MREDSNTSAAVPAEARPARAERVLVQEADDELVLLKLDQGTYFALNEVGARVWQLCEGEQTVDDIVDTLSSEFDAPRAVIAEDVRVLLDELIDVDLIDM